MPETKLKEKKQIGYINCVKGYGIWLVVLGHLLDPGMLLKTFIYSFHMPLFFSVYGMTYSRPENFKALLRRLFKRFLSYGVTYIIWALIYCSFSFKNLALVLFGSNESLTAAQSSGVLWFLPCYFIAAAVFEAVMFLLSDRKHGIAAAGVVFAAAAVIGFVLGRHTLVSYRWPWGADIALAASLFCWVGYAVKNYIIPALSSKRLISALVCILGFGLCFLSLLVKTESGYMRMAGADYGNFPLFLLTGISGILASVILMYFIDKKIKILRTVLSCLGTYSLVIMVLQRDFTNFYQSHIPANFDNSAVALCVSFVITAACFAGSYIISRIVPELAGKYRILKK